MSTRKMILIVSLISLMILVGGIGVLNSSAYIEQPVGEESEGITIPYTGKLGDTAGQPASDGNYNFQFSIYSDRSGGDVLWSELHEEVAVSQGIFYILLGDIVSLPDSVMESEHWLEVTVRGPGERDFSTLSPRQQLSASIPIESATASNGATCAHDHWGESWIGNGTGLVVHHGMASGAAVLAREDGTGVYGMANLSNAYGGEFFNAAGTALYAESQEATGVYGTSQSNKGVFGSSSDGDGVYGMSLHGNAVEADGVYGSTKYNAALRVNNGQVEHGMAAWITNISDYHNSHFKNAGTGGVLFLENEGNSIGLGGGDFITAVGQEDVQFRVDSGGGVQSDSGYFTPASDFAEMLPAEDGLEPGDVLVIGPDGVLILSTGTYQTNVAGVYSMQPGFVGGKPLEGEAEGEVPLAIVGIVPVKVSTENGFILPGDLLVTSSTPGYAMKAGPDAPQGSILGKAMQGLESGQGVIKILVTLQ